MTPLANLIAGLATFVAVLIPVMRAFAELWKSVKERRDRKSAEVLSARVIELEADQTITRKYIECVETRDKYAAQLATLGYPVFK